jgi:3D (Asp-Asp-Asp) domain-containing protein
MWKTLSKSLLLAVVGSAFINNHAVGEGRVEISPVPSKSLYLAQKTLPPTFHIKEAENGQNGANTEAQEPSNPIPNYKEIQVKATAYVSYCDTGCIGITKTGTDVSNTIYHPSGKKIIAVDPTVIPLGSHVEINGEEYIADDTGGAIQGNRIDVLVATRNTDVAFDYGVKELTIKVYSNH